MNKNKIKIKYIINSNFKKKISYFKFEYLLFFLICLLHRKHIYKGIIVYSNSDTITDTIVLYVSNNTFVVVFYNLKKKKLFKKIKKGIKIYEERR